MSTQDIENITNSLNYVYIDNENESEESYDYAREEMISYINMQNIDKQIKDTVINLIFNDNYNSYLDIYNICIDNNIELPPLI